MIIDFIIIIFKLCMVLVYRFLWLLDKLPIMSINLIKAYYNLFSIQGPYMFRSWFIFVYRYFGDPVFRAICFYEIEMEFLYPRYNLVFTFMMPFLWLLGFLIIYIFTTAFLRLSWRMYKASNFRFWFLTLVNHNRYYFAYFKFLLFYKKGYLAFLNRYLFFKYLKLKNLGFDIIQTLRAYGKNHISSLKIRLKRKKEEKPQSYWRQKLYERNQKGMADFELYLKELESTPAYQEHIAIERKKIEERLEKQKNDEIEYYETRKKKIGLLKILNFYNLNMNMNILKN